MADNKDIIKVGSRKSELALIQTRHVIKQLQELNPDKVFEIETESLIKVCFLSTVTMNTLGDKILDKPLPKIGEKSLFTKELETAMLNGEISFVVHSLKDLPTTLPSSMAIAAACKREDPRDIAVFHLKHKGKCLSSLPPNSVIGTSSLRRLAQLAHKHPHLIVKDVRGNLNTRLSKLDKDDQYDGLLLARAGVTRMGWEDRISQCLDKDDMLYCVGQGALAVECRDDDEDIIQLIEPLSDRHTTLCTIAERSFLRHLGGGCSAPVGVHSHVSIDENGDEVLSLTGGVWSLDGKEALQEEKTCRFRGNDTAVEPPRKIPHLTKKLFCGLLPSSANSEHCSAAQQLGEDVASCLMRNGASKIMEVARQANEKKEVAKTKA